MNIPRQITPEFIDEQIQDIEWIHDENNQKYVVCVITVENGFKVTGVSHRQFSTEHDESIAMKAAKEKAIDQLWAHYSFLAHAVHLGSLSNQP